MRRCDVAVVRSELGGWELVALVGLVSLVSLLELATEYACGMQEARREKMSRVQDKTHKTLDKRDWSKSLASEKNKNGSIWVSADSSYRLDRSIIS